MRGYLLSHKVLAKGLRGKLLDTPEGQGLQPPGVLPKPWVVDCKRLDHDDTTVYLGRYLHRGVIQERDILRWDDSGVACRRRSPRPHSRSSAPPRTGSAAGALA